MYQFSWTLTNLFSPLYVDTLVVISFRKYFTYSITGCTLRVIILTKEQVNGLEPIASAWKADILPLKLYLLLFHLYLVNLLGSLIPSVCQRHHVDTHECELYNYQALTSVWGCYVDYGRRDSNSHAFLQRYLKPPCIPISPHPLGTYEHIQALRAYPKTWVVILVTPLSIRR